MACTEILDWRDTQEEAQQMRTRVVLQGIYDTESQRESGRNLSPCSE